MSRRRVTVVLAIMAALAGAPSSVSAAAPNQLSDATVVPTSGSTSTPFVISVRYRSPAGNPAIAVTANAGGRVAVLALVSGSATDGVWRASTTMPPGEWAVVVRATVAKGPQPSLSIGTVTVGGATAGDSPPDDGPPSFGAGPIVGGDGAPSSPQPQPAATPAANPAASQAPARSSSVAAPSQPPTGPSSGGAASGGAAPAGPGRSGEAPARSPRARASEDNVASDGAWRSPAASPTTDVAPAPGRGDGDLGLFVVMGSLAVGMLALAAAAWMILAGRRYRRTAALPGSPGADPGVIAATVERRALRRARLRSSDDPILAAMGLPDDKVPDAGSPPRGKPARSRGRRRRPPS